MEDERSNAEGGPSSPGDGQSDAGDPPETDSLRDPAVVRRTYDRIADHFAETRHSPWPEVRGFLDSAPRGGVGLDLGCGNGRHAGLLADRVRRTLCADASRDLLRIARERVADAGDRTGEDPTGVKSAEFRFLQADAAALPVRDGQVDLALYVATVHHLPDRGARVRSLDELARVLAPGGRALVSAWSTAHDRFDAGGGSDDAVEGFDTTIDWTLPGGETVPRFYHIYAPAEFRADLAASDLSVLDVRVSSGNCYAEVGLQGEDG